MSKAASDRILVKGEAIQAEAKVGVAGTLTPGELVEFDGLAALQVHSTADGTAQKRFVRERDLFGKDKLEAIPVGDNALIIVPIPGSIVQAFLADGENVAKGASLVSDGLGSLKAPATPVATTPAGIVVGFAAAALNNTSGSPARLNVEVA